jgi:AcrR family transcriptional regulator
MDARVARTHAAVMQAATDLLVEGGPNAMTVDAVVARSGVAKSTVYRHWATRDDLVNDVFHHCAPLLDLPGEDTSFVPALRELAYSLVKMLGDPSWRRLMPAMMLLKAEIGTMAELEDDMKQQQFEVMVSVLQRGIDEGFLSPDVLDDVNETITLFAGPLLMAGLTETVPLSREFADRTVDHFLAANRVVAAAT